MENMNVLVTGVGGGCVGEQIIKAIRLSQQVDYTIIGGDIHPDSKGLTEVDFSYIFPLARDPNYVQTLLNVCRKHHVQAVFVGSDPELQVLSRHQSVFADAKIFLPVNPPEVLDVCMDKLKTISVLSSLGFSVPQTKDITNMDDLRSIDFFPVVLKPSVGGGGSVNVMVAQDEKELLSFCTYLLSIYASVVAQEYLGTPENEYTAGVLCDASGTLIHSIALKRNISKGLSKRIQVKNHTGRKELGETLVISSGISQGDIGPFPQVTAVCEAVALKLKACYAINLQCRLVKDQVYIFEINPRFSGTTSLRAMVGYNEPDILARKHVLHEDISTRFDYQSGTIARGLKEVLIPEVNISQAKDL